MEGKSLEDMAYRFCKEELSAYLIYNMLFQQEENPKLRESLAKAAERELAHYEFWKTLAGRDCRDISKLRINLFLLSRRLLGLTFTLRLLERGEKKAVREYSAISESLRAELREKVREILEDEEEHEEAWMKALAEEERVVRYLGFIALGVADSIIELTGVFAGFLGATASTRLAGLAGLVVGIAAALSMAGAAYAQARHEAESKVDPLTSAIATGLSYIFVVILLTTPFLLLENATIALATSLATATAIVSAFTLYSSVIKNTSYLRDLSETLAVMIVTIIIAYV
ncbi:MAG: hypothetical protein QW617_04430, partial [Acidilobaceae archaeon]